MIQRAFVVLALACLCACVLSIADSLATPRELCGKCGGEMFVSGPFGEPKIQAHVVQCDYCGYGYTRVRPVSRNGQLTLSTSSAPHP